MKHGQGTLWSASGTKYVGQFLNDQKHGQGQIFFSDGSINLEEWRNGQLRDQQRIAKPTAENA